VIVKDLRPQAEHLFEQMSMLFRIMRFDNDNHVGNFPLVLGRPTRTDRRDIQ
jgi:hypothetical protein